MGAQEFTKEGVFKEQEGEKGLFDPNLRAGALCTVCVRNCCCYTVVGSLFA
jgi:hypothetical protein